MAIRAPFDLGNTPTPFALGLGGFASGGSETKNRESSAADVSDISLLNC
jgi:hypothetical protein